MSQTIVILSSDACTKDSLSEAIPTSFEIVHYSELSDLLQAIDTGFSFEAVFLGEDIMGRINSARKLHQLNASAEIRLLAGNDDYELVRKTIELSPQVGKGVDALNFENSNHFKSQLERTLDRAKINRQLSRTTNKFNESLKQEKISKLELAISIEDAFDSLPLGIAIIDQDSKVICINRSGWELIGMRVDQIIGNAITQYIAKEDVEAFSKHVKTSTESQAKVEGVAFRSGIQDVDWVHCTITPLKKNASICVFYDFSRIKESELVLEEDNKRLDQLVKERTEALEKANKALVKSNDELESFTYIASHDLKEPLRGIKSLIGFIIEDYSDCLDEDGIAMMNKLPKLVGRLEMFIDQLLEYSKVGRTEDAYKWVDLNKVYEDIVSTLEHKLEEENVKITVETTLPTVYCDSARIGEVFRNLITNAYKYNKRKDKEICIGYKQDKEVFYVKDNGIGIAPKDQDKVFAIFKRLHGKEQYSGGSGAGLSIVKKIIETHNGKIWIESELEQGTTFFFNLNAA